jgi:RNA-binding protein YlmH
MMDRRQLLDRAARNGDERVLLAHILDKCEQSRNRNIPSATDFLSPAEQRSAQDLLHAAAIHDGCAFCGGFERAERRMILFLPDWQEEADESEYMTALRCTYRKEDTLTHRDFLGSLMAQGVTREKLGDILVSEGSCDLIVSRDIAPYLLQNVTSAGRVKLSVSEIELSDLSVPELKVKEIRDTVSTLRLDAERLFDEPRQGAGAHLIRARAAQPPRNAQERRPRRAGGCDLRARAWKIRGRRGRRPE